MEKFRGARYIKIRDMDVANGEGIGCAVYFQGCTFHCFNCFNKETWSMEAGEEWTNKQTEQLYQVLSQSHIKRVSYLGGEPMLNRNLGLLVDITDYVREKYPDKLQWMYSGFLFEDLVGMSDVVDAERVSLTKRIVSNLDILVDGVFMDDKKNFKLRYRGSENQRIIRAHESVDADKVILAEDLMMLRD